MFFWCSQKPSRVCESHSVDGLVEARGKEYFEFAQSIGVAILQERANEACDSDSSEDEVGFLWLQGHIKAFKQHRDSKTGVAHAAEPGEEDA